MPLNWIAPLLSSLIQLLLGTDYAGKVAFKISQFLRIFDQKIYLYNQISKNI